MFVALLRPSLFEHLLLDKCTLKNVLSNAVLQFILFTYVGMQKKCVKFQFFYVEIINYIFVNKIF